MQQLSEKTNKKWNDHHQHFFRVITGFTLAIFVRQNVQKWISEFPTKGLYVDRADLTLSSLELTAGDIGGVSDCCVLSIILQ